MRCPITGIWLRSQKQRSHKGRFVRPSRDSHCEHVLQRDSKWPSGNWTAPFVTCSSSWWLGWLPPLAHWLWGVKGANVSVWREDLSSLGHWSVAPTLHRNWRMGCPVLTVTCQRLGSQGLERDTARAQTWLRLIQFLKNTFQRVWENTSFLR